MRGTIIVAAAALCAGTAAGQVIENFEHGNEALFGFAFGTVDNMNIVAAAARHGSFGAEFTNVASPSWRTRFDIPTAPGNKYSAHVRTRAGASSGRIYLGVGAHANGAFSAVFAPNSSQIILQNNGTWATVNIQTAPFTFSAGTWYVLELDWAANGDMTVNLYDDTHTSLLASTPTAATGYTMSGGIALRGFTSTSFPNDIDDITRTGGDCYPDCNGNGALTVADFGCFQTAFVAGSTYADCNGNGALTVADFGCFQTAFVAGCP
jgi:hypothetical protein